MRPCICTVLLISAAVLADSATQSDWSDGSGVQGPVADWASSFYAETNTDWNSFDGSIQLTRILAPGTMTSIISDFNSLQDACPVDIDADGDMDVFACFTASNLIAWWENADGTGTSWIQHVISTTFLNPFRMTIGDINGDGLVDVVCLKIGSSPSAPEYAWWENTGTSNWIQHSIADAVFWPRGVTVADLDGDSDNDVAVCRTDNPTAVVWFENLSGLGDTWSEHVVCATYQIPEIIIADDLDLDGDNDLLSHDGGGGAVTWWENEDGLGETWTTHVIYQSSTLYPEGVECGDLDSDGDLDVAVICGSNPAVRWYENTDGGGLSWVQHEIDYYCDADEIRLCDFLGDGQLDVVVSCGQLFLLYTNDGDLTFSKDTIAAGYLYGGGDIYLADMDGNSAVDLFTASVDGENEMAWWNASSYVGSGSLTSSIRDTGIAGSVEWGTITWLANMPTWTNLGFQVRGSNNPSDMGAWSSLITTSGTDLSGYIDPTDRYIQYQVIMITSLLNLTPVLNEVSVSWNLLSTEEDPLPMEFYLEPVSPNPTTVSLSVSFGLPQTSLVELSVFDISGRSVTNPQYSECQPGWHTVQLEELRPGIYFVHLKAGEYEATERFVVIE